ncbi:MAG: WYL domain-containing protein, partial [Isosphaeraceae bacterium]
ECTKFAVYRLLVHDHHWFLVGRSSFHRRVDVIGVPWISRAESTDDPYRIPPRFDLERFLAQAWGVERSPHRYRVRLRFSARAAPVAEETHRHRALRRTALAGGAVELEFIVDGLDEILKWVQGYGDEVEVVEPGELRLLLFKVAVAVANRHAPEPD